MIIACLAKRNPRQQATYLAIGFSAKSVLSDRESRESWSPSRAVDKACEAG